MGCRSFIVGWLISASFFLISCAKELMSADALTSASCTFIDQDYGTPGTVAIQGQKMITGLEVPWSIAVIPGSNDMLVTERPGRVRLVRNDTLVSEPVLTLNVTQRGEDGLLGIVVHPNFAENRFFYVYYTLEKPEGAVNRVERFKLSDDAQSAVIDRVIIDDIPAAQFHDGGRLRFGPDGMLYVGTGDARSLTVSQNQESVAGKILRLNPDGGVPNDNSSMGSPVYISGVRNPQGFDWLSEVTMIIADHGPSGELGRTGGDELNVASAGANLGWSTIWRCEERAGMVSPVISWNEALPPGGTLYYKSDKIPEWKNSVLITALGAEHLQRVTFKSQGNSIQIDKNEVYLNRPQPDGFGRLREIVVSPQGDLLVTTSNCDGRGDCPDDKDYIVRIVPK